jgi:hypothetical protein
MEEIWRDVVGYEGLYKVSNLGNVFSNYTDKIMKPGTTRDGYKYVFLSRDKIRKMKTIHRLVAKAFLENPNNLPIVNHKDEDPSNNNVKNLEWCTITYNNTYNDVHIRRAQLLAKHVYRYNENGEIFEEYDSVHDAVRALNASSGDIVDCCNGNLNTYLNSVWSYNVLSKQDVFKKFKSSKPDRKNNKLSKPVNQYTISGNLIASYPSARETSRQLGISQSLISSVCRGENPHTHGFVFRYIN